MVPVPTIREQLDLQFRRVLAPKAFKLDIGPVPPQASEYVHRYLKKLFRLLIAAQKELWLMYT